MSEDEKKFEVWGTGEDEGPAFASDDPVEIGHWLRKSSGYYTVHPTGSEFSTGSMAPHQFLKKYRSAIANDIVKRAVEKGSHEGVAEDLYMLYYGW